MQGSARIRWPRARRCWSSRSYWTLRAPRRSAGRARHGAVGLAIALVVALACGCAHTGPAAPADAAYGVPIAINTPQGLRAKQDIELRTNDAGLVDRFEVTMQPPVIKKWSDIDAELTASGARYSYQVSKVDNGQCSTVA